ncbi:MAG: hypothetical protein IT175_01025 [Acidobacteria bacterium]|nr:hypothetical protein [Acidobacteriota bacterium]
MTEPVERRFTQEFARYYDLYVPEGEGPFPLVLGMHGYGGDKSSMMRLCRRISETRYAFVALQAPHQHVVYPEKREEALKYAFGWASNYRFDESLALHRDAIHRVLRDMQDDARIAKGGAFFLGFSQAVAFNLRIALTQPAVVRGVVGICGGVPGDLQSNADYVPGEFDVLMIGGAADEFYGPERMARNCEALEKHVRTVAVRTFECGHVVPRDVHPLIDAWLAERA